MRTWRWLHFPIDIKWNRHATPWIYLQHVYQSRTMGKEMHQMSSVEWWLFTTLPRTPDSKVANQVACLIVGFPNTKLSSSQCQDEWLLMTKDTTKARKQWRMKNVEGHNLAPSKLDDKVHLHSFLLIITWYTPCVKSHYLCKSDYKHNVLLTSQSDFNRH